MIDALFNQPNLVAAKRLLDATVMRHEAIAANLANLETPNYKRVDIPRAFEDELRKAISTRDPRRIAAVRPHLEVDGSAVSVRRDGNTVSLEGELIRLNRNGVEHAVESHFITGSYLKLRHAITGRSA